MILQSLIEGINALQRRRCLIVWTTLAFGAAFVMTARAIHLQRQHKGGAK